MDRLTTIAASMAAVASATYTFTPQEFQEVGRAKADQSELRAREVQPQWIPALYLWAAACSSFSNRDHASECRVQA
jgi:hypothetical protein